MKIAILGTRGIPNQYGGFEQLAEYLSAGLRERGHEVYVYSSSNHIYQDAEWNGIRLLHKYDPEKKIGTAGQFIYDLNCIIDSRKRNFDVLLNLGYTSSAVWLRLVSPRTRIVTNMDGLEWKRTKYSKPVQAFLRYAEKLAVKLSDALVADSLAIKEYLKNKFSAQAHFVAYGANIVDEADEGLLGLYGLSANRYHMLIARMEPENNIEMILRGVAASASNLPFVVVGSTANKFGNYLRSEFRNEPRIRFLGSEYDAGRINSLRFYSRMYFHGHSVGGTNPSLLEAMGNGCLVAAHDNIFNRSVLGPDALYFSDLSGVSALVSMEAQPEWLQMRANDKKVLEQYSWPSIVDSYESVLRRAMD